MLGNESRHQQRQEMRGARPKQEGAIRVHLPAGISQPEEIQIKAYTTDSTKSRISGESPVLS